jgi:hypothetical protein
VKLSTETKTFPVKLTDPVTAVLYITSDQLHMQELKHAIHVKDLSLGEFFFSVAVSSGKAPVLPVFFSMNLRRNNSFSLRT